MEYASKLCTLPLLTHLALNDMVPWNAVEELLQDCRCLQVLVVQWSKSEESGRERAEEAPFNDVRFLMTTFDRMEDAALEPPNLWSQAAAFGADKRSGKIDSRCSWMTRGEEEDVDKPENEESEEGSEISILGRTEMNKTSNPRFELRRRLGMAREGVKIHISRACEECADATGGIWSRVGASSRSRMGSFWLA
ncbi:hypothetical protein C8F01DRAFT_1080529 [Mycena amicta]|nr:hypothetical protein C8F01DRAFT_1080529 [Mycena amicta]